VKRVVYQYGIPNDDEPGEATVNGKRR
jgi:hypothetical protein